MVEILDVGTVAETCHISGRGMINGLRGTIVYFDVSNLRYTLELEQSGEMISLRQRNVIRSSAAASSKKQEEQEEEKTADNTAADDRDQVIVETVDEDEDDDDEEEMTTTQNVKASEARQRMSGKTIFICDANGRIHVEQQQTTVSGPQPPVVVCDVQKCQGGIDLGFKVMKMKDILDLGTEVETCYTAGKGMNGLRGTIVRFDTTNQRYTLELEDSGEMMSLRRVNVRRAPPSKKKQQKKEGATADGTTRRLQEQQRKTIWGQPALVCLDVAKNEQPPSNYAVSKVMEMCRILDVGTEAQTCAMAGRGMNCLRGTIVRFNASDQRYTLELEQSGEMLSLPPGKVRALVAPQSSSPIGNAILVVVAAYAWMMFFCDNSSNYFHYDYWSLPSISGTMAIGTLAFVMWKFGTTSGGNGGHRLRWDAKRFSRRFYYMGLCDIILFGWLLEHCLVFLIKVANRLGVINIKK